MERNPSASAACPGQVRPKSSHYELRAQRRVSILAPAALVLGLGTLSACGDAFAAAGTHERPIGAHVAPSSPPSALGVDPQQAKIDLGRRLLFDLDLSRPRGVSCGMCHDPQTGWGDGRPQGKGVQDNTLDSAPHEPTLAIEGNRFKTRTLARNTPTIYNSHLFPNQFWDMRAGDLAHQALFPFEEGAEMNSSWQDHILPLLRSKPSYRAQFESAFGSVELTGATWNEASLTLTQAGAFAAFAPVEDDELVITGGTGATPGAYTIAAKLNDDTIELETSIGAAANRQSDVTATLEVITRIRGGAAIGAYEETISVFDTPFDAYSAGDTGALTVLQQQGHDLFFEEVGNGGAGCFECHPAPDLTDLMAHNIGVPQAGVMALNGEVDLGVGVRTDLTQDPAVVHDDPADYAKFKTPQLRMVGVTGPYMHNGAFKTLEEVVDFYDQGGGPDLSGTGTKDPLIQPLNLTQQEKDALVAFVREALLGTEIK